MNRQALKNLFEQKSSRTTYGTVISKLGGYRFRVQTDTDRTAIVNGNQDWGLGTKVIIQNGLIIGTGAKSTDFETHWV